MPLVIEALPVESPSTSFAADSQNEIERMDDFDCLRNALVDQRPFPHVLQHPLRAFAWLFEVAFGVVCLVSLLVAAAAVPVLNLFAFGYLLESQARIVRSGKLRHGFPLLPAARRLGIIALSVTLLLLPVTFLADLTRDMWLAAPARPAAWLSALLLVIVVVLTIAHLWLALARGGSLGCFLRPIKNVRWLLNRKRSDETNRTTFDHLIQLMAAMRLTHHFKLGLVGYIGTYIWLTIPTLVYTWLPAGQRWQQATLLLGGLALALVSIWVPFLQVQFATAARPAAIFDLRRMRDRFRNAPFAWLVAFFVLLGLSVLPPLYQVRIKQQLPPHELYADVLLLTLVLTFPGRALVAWAYHRGGRERRIWRTWQWTNRAALLAVAGFYVAFLLLAASAGELGQSVIWQHHAMLLPWPW